MAVAAAPDGALATASRPVALDLTCLDGIRGLTSVFIVVGHILTFFVPVADVDAPFGMSPPPRNGPPLRAAWTEHVRWPLCALEYLSAVTLFFVLSGFTLVHVYETPVAPGAPLPLSTPSQRAHFLRKRVARLAPVYYASLLLAAVPFFVTFAGDQLALGIGVPAALLGLQSVIVFYAQNWNGSLWNVSALGLCYLCFPSLLCRLRTYSYARLRGIIVAMAVVSALLAWAFLGSGSLMLAPALHYTALFRLPQFVIGVASAIMAQRRQPRRPVLAAELCSLVLCINIMGCAMVSAAAAPRWAMYRWSMWAHCAQFLLPWVHGIWLAALTAPLPSQSSCSGCHRGLTHMLLSCAPLRHLGGISYALYCMHFPTLQWAVYVQRASKMSWTLTPLLQPGDTITVPVAARAVMSLLVLCLLVATVTHVALEPSVNVKRGASVGAKGSAAAVHTAAASSQKLRHHAE